MGEVRHEGLIEGPRSAVFDYVNSYQNVPEYMFGVKKFAPRTEQTEGVGATFDAAIDIGPKTLKSTVKCVEWVENEVIRLEAVEGFGANTTWRFADEGDGTKLDVHFDYKLPGGLAGKALGALVGPFANQAIKHTENKIAVHVDSLG